MRLKNSRRGSVTVFVMIIMSSIMLLVMMFITLSAQRASYAYVSDVLNLAGRSVLSEFDLELKERYNLIAFYGKGPMIERKLLKYSDYSLKNNRYMTLDEVDVNLKEYSIMNTEIFKEAICEGKVISENSNRTAGKVWVSDRTLRSSSVINSLPSYGMELKTPGIISAKEKLEEYAKGGKLLKNGSKMELADNYILEYFSSGAYGESDDRSFFRGEIEYILEGNYSDAANLEDVKNDILKIRTILNSIYLWSSETKSAEALMAAELITPGPQAVVTEAAIIEAWALKEAKADVEILTDGGKVPLLKNDELWISERDKEIGDKVSGYDEGLTYDEYLEILLALLDSESKYIRMMDIIQINLKGTYGGDFNIRDMYVGMKFEAVIGGRKFIFDEKY